ncbi:MAG: DUF309 domain-containing protein [Planctomycetes bacterium]|nr:DUF309 domain-containing protein [Planctomycetota bacterium]OJW03252.1 MAG: hypothetical protein BGO49_11000 [Planctomycetales bacterium 71-10]
MGTNRAYQPRPLPSSTYVPGGRRPRPRHDPGLAAVPPIVGDSWRTSDAYLRGFDLFDAGFYWEAHESWEALWHAHGRKGPIADVLKGLIKLAAAGVKVRQGRPGGVRSLAARAAGHFETARGEAGPELLGLDLAAWIDFAKDVAERPSGASAAPEGPAVVVFVRRPARPGGGSPACDATTRPAAGT